MVGTALAGIATNLVSSPLDDLRLPWWATWPVLALLVYGLAYLAVLALDRPGHAGDPGNPEAARAVALERVRGTWIDGVLRHSLHRTARVELGLAVADGLPRPWRMTATRRHGPDRRPRPASAVPEVYDDLDRAMLIAGAPGAGKSTLLLELLEHLLDRAAADDRQPVPVVLQLPGWAAERRPFAEWVAGEVGTRYDIPARYAEAWLHGDRLALLLDGLDEVAEKYREDCVQEINAFRGEHRLTPLVVCSRTTDYEKLTARLDVYGTLTVLPLERATVERFLREGGAGLAGMRAALAADPGLWELLDSPLLLSVMALAYRDGGPVAAPGEPGDGPRRWLLFDTYTATMVRRRPDPRFGVEQTVTWLAFLAHQMNRDAQVLFTPDRVRETWAIDAGGRFLLDDGAGLMGLAGASLLAIPGYLAAGLPGALGAIAVGSLFGRPRSVAYPPLRLDLLHLTLRVDEERRETRFGRTRWAQAVHTLKRDFGLLTGRERRFERRYRIRLHHDRKVRRARPAALGAGAAAGALFGWDQGWPAVAGGAAAVAVVMTVAGVVVWRFAEAVYQAEPGPRWSEVPGPRVRGVLAEGVRTALALGTAAGTFTGLVVALTSLAARGLAVGALVAFGTFLYGLGALGGQAAIQQYLLRRGLRRAGLFPLPSRPFLDHAVRCQFMRPAGEGYLFVHRSLLEYLASLTDARGRVKPDHVHRFAAGDSAPFVPSAGSKPAESGGRSPG
ncbi:hypothetical protein Sru01_36580 [Sphaerisporangium rufum]|uniref:NACHT domain-containing protein n=1 Tax=Sphaerisporangium rufum TaxID=1381558 RepID=A0A919R5B1_9ACTN|nr:hypothetical protein [Sphaerisporangium rufum]GII78676.1 hypothetical protein Sru01_36580 [Sphaerisporangium rufum]